MRLDPLMLMYIKPDMHVVDVFHLLPARHLLHEHLLLRLSCKIILVQRLILSSFMLALYSRVFIFELWML